MGRLGGLGPPPQGPPKGGAWVGRGASLPDAPQGLGTSKWWPKKGGVSTPQGGAYWSGPILAAARLDAPCLAFPAGPRLASPCSAAHRLALSMQEKSPSFEGGKPDRQEFCGFFPAKTLFLGCTFGRTRFSGEPPMTPPDPHSRASLQRAH